jgi:hypothetical protein
MGDYQVSFLPIQQDCGPPPRGWQIDRRFYRELLTPRLNSAWPATEDIGAAALGSELIGAALLGSQHIGATSLGLRLIHGGGIGCHRDLLRRCSVSVFTIHRGAS